MYRVRKVMVWSLSVIFLCFSVGCSGYPFGYTIVNNTGQLEKKADIRLMEKPSDDQAHLMEIDRWQSHSRVAYHSSYSKNRWMVVEGQLDDGKKYPVVLDTGASLPLFVNDIHILENKNDQLPDASSANIRLLLHTCRCFKKTENQKSYCKLRSNA